MSAETGLPHPRVRWPIVLAAGFLFSFRFGLNFGTGNHNTYLLHALKRVHPEAWTEDWLVSTTQDYHPVFTHLAALLLRLDESGWLLAALNVLCITLSAVLVYLIIREVVAPEDALYVYLLTVAFMGVGATYSVAGSYLFSPTLQPSTVAVMGVFLALYGFLKGRHLASGLCLALACAFHVNFALLALPWMALALAFQGRGLRIRTLVVQLAPLCVTLALLSPLLLRQAGSPLAAEARFIFQNVLSPQHYLPRTFWTEFVVFFAWCALGVLWGGRLFRSARALSALWLSALVLVSLATLFTTALFVPAVSQLYAWRLAPFAVLVAQIALAAGLVRQLSGEPALSSWAARLGPFVLTALLVWFLFRYHYGEYRALQYGLLCGLAILWLLARLVPNHVVVRQRALLPWTVGAAWALAALWPASEAVSHSNLIRGWPEAEARLYAWARTTPETAVFLVPPKLHDFRLNARRAVVADFKSTPVDPAQLVAWHRRMSRVCGLANVTGARQADSAYALLDLARLSAILPEFHFDYVVVESHQPFAGGEPWLPVFQSRSHRVFERATRHDSR